MISQRLIEEADAQVASERKTIRFTASIERAFNEQRQSYRAEAVAASIVPSFLCYNAFLPADCLLLPATARLAGILHVLVTAWIFATALIMRAKPRLLMRELACISIPVLMVAPSPPVRPGHTRRQILSPRPMRRFTRRNAMAATRSGRR